MLLSQSTINAYIRYIKEFKIYLEDDLENLTIKHINSFTNKCIKKVNLNTKKNISPKTINKKLVALKSYIAWINTNTEIKIFVEVPLLKIQNQEYLSENILTIYEFNRIIRITEKDNSIKAIQARALLFGLYLTGMRISELLQMRVSDISKTDIWINGKGNKLREVILSDKVKFYLEEYVKARGLKGRNYVLTNVRNDSVMSRQTAHRIIKYYAGQARIKLEKAHLHNLRHLFCIVMISNNANLEEVADLAGHNNINTTRIYVRKSKQQLRKTVNML